MVLGGAVSYERGTPVPVGGTPKDVGMVPKYVLNTELLEQLDHHVVGAYMRLVPMMRLGPSYEPCGNSWSSNP